MPERRYFKMPEPKSAKKPAPAQAPMPSWKNEGNAWASKLRSSSRWQKLRAMVLRARPLCQLCSNIADQVHHIDGKNPYMFFAAENLASICEDCHKKVNSAYRRGIPAEVLFPPDQRLTPDDLT